MVHAFPLQSVVENSVSSAKFQPRECYYVFVTVDRLVLVVGMPPYVRSQPVEWVIGEINPVLRGWVNYFAAGHFSECFKFLQNWVEKKVRRHLMHARQRKGFGWKRWSRQQWLYENLKLFNGYKVWRPQPKVAPAG